MDAFRQEIVDLLPRLRRLARALARNSADADDLVQLTVERAIGRVDHWRAGTRLDSWMFRIMKNLWIDEARSRTRRNRIFAPQEAGETAPGDGAESVEAGLLGADIDRAMSKLPDEQRLAVALVLIDGLSYRDAAQTLQIPEGTLTSRLVRGRNALMVELGGLAHDR